MVALAVGRVRCENKMELRYTGIGFHIQLPYCRFHQLISIGTSYFLHTSKMLR